jgi:hypothetical protein
MPSHLPMLIICSGPTRMPILPARGRKPGERVVLATVTKVGDDRDGLKPPAWKIAAHSYLAFVTIRAS